MQALPQLKQLRSQIQTEMMNIPQYRDLKAIDKILNIYECIIAEKGMEDKQLNKQVLEAISRLIEAAHAKQPEKKKLPPFIVNRRAA